MSIESKILIRYGDTELTDADIGKSIICVVYNYTVKGSLTKIGDPFERGIFIHVLSNDGVSHLVLTGKTTGLTVVRVNDITEKHAMRSLTNLPHELSKHIVSYL